MKAFRVTGEFYMGDHWQNFTKDMAGEDDAVVREKVYSRLGSKHRVKRAKIKISEVTEIPLEEVTDPITMYILKNEKKAMKKEPEPKETKKATKLIKRDKGTKILKKRKAKKGDSNE
jgi:large subunit ribosomal protein LX